MLSACSEQDAFNEPDKQDNQHMPVLFSAGNTEATVTRASASYMPKDSRFVCSMFFHAGANDTEESVFYPTEGTPTPDVNMTTAWLKISNATGNAVYCKLPSFIIWAPLGQQSQIDYGFKIMIEGGTFHFSNYVITDSEVIDYLLYKIDKTVEWRKHLALTNPQKIKDIQAKMAADKEFQKSELAEILSKPSLSEMQLRMSYLK